MTAEITAERLDELEAIARRATQLPWTMSGVRMKLSVNGRPSEAHAVGPDGDYAAAVFYDPKQHSACYSDAKHIAAFDPPTVLALIALARRSAEAAEGVEVQQMSHAEIVAAPSTQGGRE